MQGALLTKFAHLRGQCSPEIVRIMHTQAHTVSNIQGIYDIIFQFFSIHPSIQQVLNADCLPSWDTAQKKTQTAPSSPSRSLILRTFSLNLLDLDPWSKGDPWPLSMIGF